MNMLRQALDVRRRLIDLEMAVDALAARDEPTNLLENSARLEADARYLRQRPLIVMVLLQRARILTRCGRVRESIGVLEQAKRDLGVQRQDDLTVAILCGLADAHAQLAEWETVSALCACGIDLVEQHRYDVSADYQTSAYLRSRIGLYAHGARAAYELCQPALAIERAELSKCRTALSHWRARGERTPAEACVATAAEAREAEFRELCRRIGAMAVVEKPTKKQIEELEQLEARRRQLWDWLCADRTIRPPPPFHVVDLQRCLRADEAVINYYWIERGVLAIAVIDSAGIDLEVRQLDRLTMDCIEDCATAVLRGGSLNHGTARALSSFGPDLLPRAGVADWVTKRRLFISPHRVLHTVPFHALWTDGAFLIEQHVIRYVPNLQSLLEEYGPPRERRLLALGIQKHRTMPELEQATLETRNIADSYRQAGVAVQVLEDEQATTDAWRSLADSGELERFTTIHLATHCQEVPTDAPLEVRLNLFDTSLDGLELGAMPLCAELVVTSACSSGQRAIHGRGLNEVPGDDLLGLQAAFFRAGAHQLVSTLWSVYCPYARPIMCAFHEALASDIDREPDEALQKALCARIAQGDPLEYWAPFAVFGFGRRRPEAARGGTRPS